MFFLLAIPPVISLSMATVKWTSRLITAVTVVGTVLNVKDRAGNYINQRIILQDDVQLEGRIFNNGGMIPSDLMPALSFNHIVNRPSIDDKGICNEVIMDGQLCAVNPNGEYFFYDNIVLFAKPGQECIEISITDLEKDIQAKIRAIQSTQKGQLGVENQNFLDGLFLSHVLAQQKQEQDVLIAKLPSKYRKVLERLERTIKELDAKDESILAQVKKGLQNLQDSASDFLNGKDDFVRFLEYMTKMEELSKSLSQISQQSEKAKEKYSGNNVYCAEDKIEGENIIVDESQEWSTAGKRTELRDYRQNLEKEQRALTLLQIDLSKQKAYVLLKQKKGEKAVSGSAKQVANTVFNKVKEVFPKLSLWERFTNWIMEVRGKTDSTVMTQFIKTVTGKKMETRVKETVDREFSTQDAVNGRLAEVEARIKITDVKMARVEAVRNEIAVELKAIRSKVKKANEGLESLRSKEQNQVEKKQALFAKMDQQKAKMAEISQHVQGAKESEEQLQKKIEIAQQELRAEKERLSIQGESKASTVLPADSTIHAIQAEIDSTIQALVAAADTANFEASLAQKKEEIDAIHSEVSVIPMAFESIIPEEVSTLVNNAAAAIQDAPEEGNGSIRLAKLKALNAELISASSATTIKQAEVKLKKQAENLVQLATNLDGNADKIRRFEEASTNMMRANLTPAMGTILPRMERFGLILQEAANESESNPFVDREQLKQALGERKKFLSFLQNSQSLAAGLQENSAAEFLRADILSLVENDDTNLQEMANRSWIDEVVDKVSSILSLDREKINALIDKARQYSSELAVLQKDLSQKYAEAKQFAFGSPEYNTKIAEIQKLIDRIEAVSDNIHQLTEGIKAATLQARENKQFAEAVKVEIARLAEEAEVRTKQAESEILADKIGDHERLRADIIKAAQWLFANASHVDFTDIHEGFNGIESARMFQERFESVFGDAANSQDDKAIKVLAAISNNMAEKIIAASQDKIESLKDQHSLLKIKSKKLEEIQSGLDEESDDFKLVQKAIQQIAAVERKMNLIERDQDWLSQQGVSESNSFIRNIEAAVGLLDGCGKIESDLKLRRFDLNPSLTDRVLDGLESVGTKFLQGADSDTVPMTLGADVNAEGARANIVEKIAFIDLALEQMVGSSAQLVALKGEAEKSCEMGVRDSKNPREAIEARKKVAATLSDENKDKYSFITAAIVMKQACKILLLKSEIEQLFLQYHQREASGVETGRLLDKIAHKKEEIEQLVSYTKAELARLKEEADNAEFNIVAGAGIAGKQAGLLVEVAGKRLYDESFLAVMDEMEHLDAMIQAFEKSISERTESIVTEKVENQVSEEVEALRRVGLEVNRLLPSVMPLSSEEDNAIQKNIMINKLALSNLLSDIRKASEKTFFDSGLQEVIQYVEDLMTSHIQESPLNSNFYYNLIQKIGVIGNKEDEPYKGWIARVNDMKLRYEDEKSRCLKPKVNERKKEILSAIAPSAEPNVTISDSLIQLGPSFFSALASTIVGLVNGLHVKDTKILPEDKQWRQERENAYAAIKDNVEVILNVTIQDAAEKRILEVINAVLAKNGKDIVSAISPAELLAGNLSPAIFEEMIDKVEALRVRTRNNGATSEEDGHYTKWIAAAVKNAPNQEVLVVQSLKERTKEKENRSGSRFNFFAAKKPLPDEGLDLADSPKSLRGFVRGAVGAFSAFITNASAWVSTLFESGGTGFL